MKKRNKVLTALGAIALGSTGMASHAHAQESDSEYQAVCDWLSTQSIEGIQDFMRRNPESACIEVAAQLLAERAEPEAGVRAPGPAGRY